MLHETSLSSGSEELDACFVVLDVDVESIIASICVVNVLLSQIELGLLSHLSTST